jgi:hypothetical protein
MYSLAAVSMFPGSTFRVRVQKFAFLGSVFDVRGSVFGVQWRSSGVRTPFGTRNREHGKKTRNMEPMETRNCQDSTDGGG